MQIKKWYIIKVSRGRKLAESIEAMFWLPQTFIVLYLSIFTSFLLNFISGVHIVPCNFGWIRFFWGNRLFLPCSISFEGWTHTNNLAPDALAGLLGLLASFLSGNCKWMISQFSILTCINFVYIGNFDASKHHIELRTLKMQARLTWTDYRLSSWPTFVF